MSNSKVLRRAQAAAARLDRELVTTRAFKRGQVLHSSEDRTSLQALSRVNVSAVAVGKRVIDGVVTDQDVVNFYVHRKLPLALIDKGFKVPKTLAGMPTNVVQAHPVQFTAPALLKAQLVESTRQRPISGGLAVGRADGGGGTLGMIVRSTNPQTRDDSLILGSGHVFTRYGTIADACLIQPNVARGGSAASDSVGTFVRSNAWTPGSARDCRFDAAIATLEVEAIAGFPAGPALDPQIIGTAVENQTVKIYGGVNQLAIGEVESVSFPARYTAPINGNVYAFDKSLRIVAGKGQRLSSGDSGAIVLSEDGTEAVGILFAIQEGAETSWLASPLQRVAYALKFTL